MPIARGFFRSSLGSWRMHERCVVELAGRDAEHPTTAGGGLVLQLSVLPTAGRWSPHPATGSPQKLRPLPRQCPRKGRENPRSFRFLEGAPRQRFPGGHPASVWAKRGSPASVEFRCAAARPAKRRLRLITYFRGGSSLDCSRDERGAAVGDERGAAVGDERGAAVGDERGAAVGDERGAAVGDERGAALNPSAARRARQSRTSRRAG